jgi:hypothetical protein
VSLVDDQYNIMLTGLIGLGIHIDGMKTTSNEPVLIAILIMHKSIE